MAITKITTIHAAKKGNAAIHLNNAIKYIKNAKKTDGGRLVGALNCDPDHAFQQMVETKQFYDKLDKRQGYHLVISFSPEETDAETAFEIVAGFAREFIGERYECVFAVHNDSDHIHGHIIFNSVCSLDGHKFRYENGDWAKIMQPITNKLCEKYGLQTIDVMEHGLRLYSDYGAWYDDQIAIANPLLDQMRKDIDAAILNSVNLDDVIEILEENYTVRSGKKFLSLKPSDRERGIRTYRLGYAYSMEGILQRLSGETFNLASYETLMPDKQVRMHRAGYHMRGQQGIYATNKYRLYKKDVDDFHYNEINRNYMMQHGLTNAAQVIARIENLNAAIEKFNREQKHVFMERKKHKAAIQLLNDTQKSESEINASLRIFGYDPDQIRKFDANTKMKLEEIRRSKKACRYETKICENLLQYNMEEPKRTR